MDPRPRADHELWIILGALALCAVMVLLTMGCGGALQGGTIGSSPSTPVRWVPRGINDGFHGGLSWPVVTADCGYKQPFTIRTPQTSGAGLDAFMLSIKACWSPLFHNTLHVLALVENPSVPLAAELARRQIDAIELGNELELPPNNLTPIQYMNFIDQAYQAVRAANPSVTIITGGVYALTPDTKQRIVAAMSVCPGCWVGIHLYEPLSPADKAWLASLQLPIAVTETGYATKCDPNGAYHQQTYLDQMLYDFSTVPNIQLVVIYQRPIGPSCSAADTFGLLPGVDVNLFGQAQ